MIHPVFDFLLRNLAFLAGVVMVSYTVLSAIRSFVLPRSSPEPILRVVFRIMRYLFSIRMRPTDGYEQRDQVMAMYAPVTLVMLLPIWYIFVLVGYMLMFWAAGAESWYMAFRDSGSSLLTLGFESVNTFPFSLIAFSEATIGLLLVALLISYLPTMYAAFSRREAAVTLLDVRAGSPPSAVEMLKRYHRIHGLDQLGEVWQNWEVWFADVEESHTSLAALVFFRSPQPNNSWVTAAGTVLDAAALTLAVVDVPHDFRADLCIRAGFLALRRIAGFFEISYNPNPKPTDPISVTRAEFDEACHELAKQGVPLKEDRDQAWRDFAGWRVNYDQVLLALAKLTMAPETPWTRRTI